MDNRGCTNGFHMQEIFQAQGSLNLPFEFHHCPHRHCFDSVCRNREKCMFFFIIKSKIFVFKHLVDFNFVRNTKNVSKFLVSVVKVFCFLAVCSSQSASDCGHWEASHCAPGRVPPWSTLQAFCGCSISLSISTQLPRANEKLGLIIYFWIYCKKNRCRRRRKWSFALVSRLAI